MPNRLCPQAATAHTHQRRHLLRAGLALGTTLALPAARACEFFAPNFRLIHPWTRATPADADAALVCMVFEDITAPDVLVGVRTAVATRAAMGGAGPDALDGVHFDLRTGQSAALTEAGIHLRLLGLTQALEVGRAYPMTLLFRNAGALQAQLTVDYARFT